jgi:hypothetical protein
MDAAKFKVITATFLQNSCGQSAEFLILTHEVHQTCATLYVVRATWTKFGLNADDMKFKQHYKTSHPTRPQY